MDRVVSEELWHVTARYIAEYLAGKHPSVADYIARYPSYAHEIAEFVAYYHTIEEPLFSVDTLDRERTPSLKVAERAARYPLPSQYQWSWYHALLTDGCLSEQQQATWRDIIERESLL